MGIELLWLVPVIAAALFLPVIMLASKRHSGREPGRDLAREVDRFNLGDAALVPMPAEKRLSDIEVTISRVSAALSNQQRIIEDFRGKDVGHDADLIELKEKLSELQQEYDIVISENYTLRARVKKLVEQQAHLDTARGKDGEPGDEVRGPSDVDEGEAPVNMKSYDDTRMLRQSDLSDTSEINVSELR